jgi:hypothetical protein
LDGKVYVNATVDSNRDAKPIGEVAPFSVPHTAESEEQFVSVPLSSAMLATGAGLEQPPAVPKLSRDTVTDSSPSQRFNINKLLFRNGNGYTLSLSGSWSVNYNAVLAWIKDGPQTLPPNLRAGRVVYYTSIPNDVNTSSGTTEERMNKQFWRQYIDYVLGSSSNYQRERFLAGSEQMGWPNSSFVTINSRDYLGLDEGTTSTQSYIVGTPRYKAYDPDGRRNQFGFASITGGNGGEVYEDNHADIQRRPKFPYMHYLDRPSMPRLNFWFGPMSMMDFLHNVRNDFTNPDTDPNGRENMFPGTVHEAQAWQLKAGISSTLDDIRSNHPNDFCGLAFFAWPNFRTIRAPMSQDFVTTKNTLFFPQSIVPSIPTNTSLEVRPYDINFNRSGTVGAANHVIGNYPVASGATDPNSGLALAYNLAASNASLNTDPNKRGRRGASKFTIFETDGVPSAATTWTFNARGYDSTYSYSTMGSWQGSGTAGAVDPALAVVDQIVKPVSFVNTVGVDHGFSLPSAPARVYSIGFGDLFSNMSASQRTNALNFLLNVQKRGRTSATTDTALPTEQIITGDYNTRIANMRFVLERIMQSGIQVTLIE